MNELSNLAPVVGIAVVIMGAVVVMFRYFLRYSQASERRMEGLMNRTLDHINNNTKVLSNLYMSTDEIVRKNGSSQAQCNIIREDLKTTALSMSQMVEKADETNRETRRMLGL